MFRSLSISYYPLATIHVKHQNSAHTHDTGSHIWCLRRLCVCVCVCRQPTNRRISCWTHTYIVYNFARQPGKWVDNFVRLRQLKMNAHAAILHRGARLPPNQYDVIRVSGVCVCVCVFATKMRMNDDYNPLYEYLNTKMIAHERKPDDSLASHAITNNNTSQTTLDKCTTN